MSTFRVVLVHRWNLDVLLDTFCSPPFPPFPGLTVQGGHHCPFITPIFFLYSIPPLFLLPRFLWIKKSLPPTLWLNSPSGPPLKEGSGCPTLFHKTAVPFPAQSPVSPPLSDNTLWSVRDLQCRPSLDACLGFGPIHSSSRISPPVVIPPYEVLSPPTFLNLHFCPISRSIFTIW